MLHLADLTISSLDPSQQVTGALTVMSDKTMHYYCLLDAPFFPQSFRSIMCAGMWVFLTRRLF